MTVTVQSLVLTIKYPARLALGIRGREDQDLPAHCHHVCPPSSWEGDHAGRLPKDKLKRAELVVKSGRVDMC